MSIFTHRLSDSPYYAKAIAWGKLITITGGAQILIQALSFVSSILIIRLLSVQEYALYTLANTMLGTMIVLADGGLSTGVSALGVKVWQNPQKFGSVLSTGLSLRSYFIVGSLAGVIPLLLYLLHSHGASWLMSFFIMLALVPAFTSGLASTILQIPPRLHQDIGPLQKNQVVANIGRLAFLLLTIFIFPFAFVVILVSGIPQIWANTKLRKISAQYADWSQKPDPAMRQEILSIVKRILPGSLYYCFSGQITIWLLSIFGTTAAIAQLGALSRIAVVMTLFSVMFTTLVSPRFARIPIERGQYLLNRYLQLVLGLIILCTSIVGVVWLFDDQVVWILGKEYSNLKFEVLLSALSACLAFIVGACHSMCTNRGWIVNPIISIPVTIAAIAFGIVMFNVDSLRGVLILNIFTGVVEVLTYFVYTLYKFKHEMFKFDNV